MEAVGVAPLPSRTVEINVEDIRELAKRQIISANERVGRLQDDNKPMVYCPLKKLKKVRESLTEARALLEEAKESLTEAWALLEEGQIQKAVTETLSATCEIDRAERAGLGLL